jgi:hypothetical protein
MVAVGCFQYGSLASVATRDDVDAGRTISVGLSAGAFANIAPATDVILSNPLTLVILSRSDGVMQ